MPRQRLGVVLLIPAPLRVEVDALRRAVGDGSLERVPAHLTLVPPVNVHERDLDAALALVRDAAAVTAPLALDLGPPATFLPDNPVLYLDVGGDLTALSALRDRVFRPPLHRDEAWPFVPHVTLCDEGAPERIAAAAEVLAGYRASAVVSQVHVLHEVDRRWTPLADAALSGRRVVGRGGIELEITESERLDPVAAEFRDRQWEIQDVADLGPVHAGWTRADFAFTARRDGAVVGTATGHIQGGTAYLGNLIVDPDVRGEGIGAHLMASFEDLARRRGCHRMGLRTIERLDARRFYEALGWVVEARLGNWILGEDFVYLRKDL